MINNNSLTIKSNRKFIKVLCVIFLLITGTLLFLVVFGWIFDLFQYEEGDFYTVTPLLVIFVVSVICYLIAQFYKGKSYVFKDDCIEIYNNEKLVISINLSEVDHMDYYPLRLHYIITIFGGALPDGGAPKIHLFKGNGDKYIIGFIGEKEACQIKGLYPEKFTFMYERKKTRMQ